MFVAWTGRGDLPAAVEVAIDRPIPYFFVLLITTVMVSPQIECSCHLPKVFLSPSAGFPFQRDPVANIVRVIEDDEQV